MKNEPRSQLVLIHWVDSKKGPAGWEYLKRLKPLPMVECESVGFLMPDSDPRYYTLAQTMRDRKSVV